MNAEARGAAEVAALLRQNLAQEEGARDEVGQMDQRIATACITYP